MSLARRKVDFGLKMNSVTVVNFTVLNLFTGIVVCSLQRLLSPSEQIVTLSEQVFFDSGTSVKS